MESHDIVEPPQIMKMDHDEFRKRMKELYQLAYRHEEYPFKKFNGRK